MAALALPAPSFASPVTGASLLLAFRPPTFEPKTLLIIGSNALGATRAFAALEAGFSVLIADSHGLSNACEEVRWRVQHGEISWLDLPVKQSSLAYMAAAERLLDSRMDIALVCVTDTLIPVSSSIDGGGSDATAHSAAACITSLCRSRRIPVNVADRPELSDFTFPACHRFQATAANSTNEIRTSLQRKTSLQLSITTNGQACRLACRLRREIIAALPKNVGMAVENIGTMRNIAREAVSADEKMYDQDLSEEDIIGSGLAPPLNAPVSQEAPGTSESNLAAQRRRMRWIAQLSEYWPLEKLGALTREEMVAALARQDESSGDASDGIPNPKAGRCTRRLKAAALSDNTQGSGTSKDLTSASSTPGPLQDASGKPPSSDLPMDTPLLTSRHFLDTLSKPATSPKKGKILLVGSGPGHPSLLTIAAHKALTQLGTLILSDKLVPSQVLALIPKGGNVKLYVAKKYPGNSEGAQNELMDMAVEGAIQGEIVVRLKQGDPFLYGRGGEEVLFFRKAGFEPVVIPGISSALSGPLLANIPVTQRGVSESVIICTGVGRSGRDVSLPGYRRERSLVVLMGVARLGVLVQALITTQEEGRRQGAPYPTYTPVAIIERASCPDQRVVASTLSEIEGVLARNGEQMTPAMIFVGWAALALSGEGDVEVLNDVLNSVAAQGESEAKDLDRITRWLGTERSLVQQGLDESWNLF
ncbi:hypothetical protein FRB94_007824 [Tulasnella sp. JGI-2019a]|nr:hypothetical protein FRB93_007349 [Tulasnella sp. JGI-2019a]KAG8997217.1 hypothetical protein FRB94_007824 [Tulasnella sp. JGI-2019a]